MKLLYVVTSSDESIKQILKNKFNMSDRFILKLKSSNSIYINDVPVFINYKIQPNDILTIIENSKEDSSNIIPNSNIKLNVLYKDDFLLIVNKPSNLPVHPSILHYEDSLSNAVKYHFDEIGLQKKIRPVNRLDKDTSGIVIFAKNEYIQECLVKQMQSNIFKKKYLAVLSGILNTDSGTISAPIGRKNDSIIKREIRDDGDLAISYFKVLERFNNMTLVEYTLETGRTHQLRVHSKYIGHPIVGDSLYGSESLLISRQALHAYEVSFIHPISKEEMIIHCDLPDDIKNLIIKNKNWLFTIFNNIILKSTSISSYIEMLFYLSMIKIVLWLKFFNFQILIL